jgi:hypothetical protein
MNEYKVHRVKDKKDNIYTKKKLLFDLPFRLAIIGRSQLSGKSSLAVNLLVKPMPFYRNDFKGENVYIISPSVYTDEKMKIIKNQLDIPDENIFTEYDEDILMALYEYLENQFIEYEEKKEKPPNVLIYMDDLGYTNKLKDKNAGFISKLLCNGRHINISSIQVVQKYSQLSTTTRCNLTGAIIFSLMTDKDLEAITDDHNYLPDRKAFKKMYRNNTKDKHSFIIINYTNNYNEIYLDKDFKPITPITDKS